MLTKKIKALGILLLLVTGYVIAEPEYNSDVIVEDVLDNVAETVTLEIEEDVVSKDLYQIEIITFAYNKSNELEKEIWPIVLPEINYSKAVNLPQLKGKNDSDFDENKEKLEEAADEIKSEIVTLSEDKYLLNKEAKIISRNNKLRLVEHVAWQQELNPSKTRSILPIRIQGGKYLDDGMSDEYNKLDNKEISGVLLVKPVRALFQVNAEFIFNPLEKKEHAPNGYYLSRQARIKQKEIYYFDHPAFGMLVIINQIT